MSETKKDESTDEPQDVMYKSIGNKFLAQGHFDQAIDAYTKAITLNDKCAIYYANRAQAHIKSENWGSAITDAERAIELDAGYAKAYHRLGVANMGLSKFKTALPLFRRVCMLQPQDRGARSKYQEIQKLVKKIAFEEAIAFEEKSVFEEFNYKSLAVDSSYDGPKLDGAITKEFVVEMIAALKAGKKLHAKYMWQILFEAKELLEKENSLIDVTFPETGHFTVCGDVHGQFYDLANIFELNGLPSETNPYLFNGDFVDRGSWSVECLLTLLALKVLYPKHMYLNRGNHETNSMNRMYGFDDEMKHKYSQKAVDACHELFNYLPLAHCINGKVLVVHGGLFDQDGVTLDDIRKTNRFRQPPDSGIMSDILWSDPAPPGVMGRVPSKRGISMCYGPDVCKRFLDENNLELLIRSHEVKDNGYEIHTGFNNQLITVFSAPNYCDQVGNKGAYIKLDGDCHPTCVSYTAVPHPDVKPMAYSRQFAQFGM